MAERNYLIRSSECELSELAAIIKGLVETTQDSEYPDFELKPCVYALGEEKDEHYLHLWCDHWSHLDEMLGLLKEQPGHITIELGGDPSYLDTQVSMEARREFASIDKMIQQLQAEERKEKRMATEKENVPEAANQEEKREHKVYLSLPPVKSKEGFNKMISNLKEAGAKFDSYNKHWYITPDADFNKFKGFLGLPYEYVNERGKNLRAKENEKKSQEGRESVKGKLEKNKGVVEKNQTERKEPKHNRDEAR